MTTHQDADEPASFDEYTTGRGDPRPTAWLRRRAEPSWEHATTHRFTRELGDGELDDAVFRRYLVQDYAFLDRLVAAFGQAVADAPTMAARSRLVDFQATLTADENDYFERAFDALDVSPETYTDPELTPTTEAFLDLLGCAAAEGGYAETLAVLVPAEWIYREWAAAVDAGTPERFYLTEWIELHDTDEFDAFVAWLRGELDREGAAVSRRRQRRVDRVFQRTVALEVAFFDAAYEDTTEGETRW